jgi:DNA-binding PadR family transcriptional regulator
MSSNLDDSPPHFIVLNAISKNYNTVDKIAKFTKLSKSEVEKVLNELENQKLISGHDKKSFFFGKKRQYQLNEVGSKILNEKTRELEGKMRQIQQWYSEGDKTQLQSYMNDNRAWLPMMVLSGIMQAMFFMSLMSFAGMALNPMESSMAGGAAGGTDTTAADSSTAADTGGAVGGTDTTAADAGGFDFDAGGFDSF